MVVVNTLAKTEIQAFWKDSKIFFCITNDVEFRDII